jgi:hypothetical protein
MSSLMWNLNIIGGKPKFHEGKHLLTPKLISTWWLQELKMEEFEFKYVILYFFIRVDIGSKVVTHSKPQSQKIRLNRLKKWRTVFMDLDCGLNGLFGGLI